jgi:hypothetical protein
MEFRGVTPTIFGGPNLRLPGWLTAVAGHLVLIAEDSEDTRDMYGEFLEFSGFQVLPDQAPLT